MTNEENKVILIKTINAINDIRHILIEANEKSEANATFWETYVYGTKYTDTEIDLHIEMTNAQRLMESVKRYIDDKIQSIRPLLITMVDDIQKETENDTTKT